MALSTVSKVAIAGVIAGAAALTLFLDTGEGVLEYVYVDQIAENRDHFENRTFKVHGTVVEGSIKQKKGTTGDYRFVIHHKGEQLAVHFTNIPPDTFAEGGEVILTGRLSGDTFESEEMSAKCPSKYEEEAKIQGAAEPMPSRT